MAWAIMHVRVPPLFFALKMGGARGMKSWVWRLLFFFFLLFSLMCNAREMGDITCNLLCLMPNAWI